MSILSYPRVARPCAGRRAHPRRIAVQAFSPEAIGVGLFFTPGMLALVYSVIKGKGNVKDGFSHLITVLSQGVAIKRQLRSASASCSRVSCFRRCALLPAKAKTRPLCVIAV